ncbi:MAG: hypothetical protein H6739_25490 [Alphaproteobacteria bacterium]|nr:hypothetical protein [Alphaproteobacteria bacterium]
MHRDDLPIPEPCHEDWSAMTGDAQRRFCDHCDKHVHDLSEMTRDDAVALLRDAEKPCVRFACGPDGNIRFKPSRRAFLGRAGAAAVGLSVGLPAAAAAVATPEGCAEPSLLERMARSIGEWLSDVPAPVLMGEPMPPEEVLMGDVFIEIMPEPEPLEEFEVIKGKPALPEPVEPSPPPATLTPVEPAPPPATLTAVEPAPPPEVVIPDHFVMGGVTPPPREP